MKNIITIDFDIIMAPCIGLYNNMVPEWSWEQLKRDFHQLKLLNADLVHYQRLSNYIHQVIQKIPKENIVFIENHGALNKYLPNEKVNVYNIDHHHDCGYGPKEKLNNEKEEELNCANWVYDIARHGYLNFYTWIKNTSSSEEEPLYDGLINRKVNLSDCDLDKLPLPDLLVLCLSEPWTPPEYRPLYYLWADVLNTYYNTTYEIDRQINFEGEDYYGTLYKERTV